VETAPLLRDAISQLEWSVELLSVGDVTVPGATSFADMLKDDGDSNIYSFIYLFFIIILFIIIYLFAAEFPEHVEINAREDVVLIVNTSGSTGTPKGVLHSHYSVIAMLESMQ
jgi:hypothetical protein